MIFGFDFTAAYVGSIPVVTLVVGWLLYRGQRKVRSENAEDHAFVQQRLGELTGAVSAQSEQVQRVEVKVDQVQTKLDEHIGQHQGLPNVVVQVPVVNPTAGD